MTTLKYLSQYFSTTLNVGGGIDDSQTTGIILQSVSGVHDITKPGQICITYSDPIDTSVAEWIDYTSINGSNELVGAVRGREGFSAHAHLQGATVAFVLSASHHNDIVDQLNGTATGATLTSPIINTPSITTPTFQGTVDGWILANETWTYASASTINVPSGAASKYHIGDKLRLVQTTTKYFVVTAVADTVLTVLVNTDYTVANAAITNPRYSHVANPLGFPTSFAFAVTANGFSAAPSGMLGSISTIGRMATVSVYMPNAGTSNATSFSVNLPIVPVGSGANLSFIGSVQGGNDNGVYQTNTQVSAVNGASTMAFAAAGGSVNWTASGNKNATFTTIIYSF